MANEITILGVFMYPRSAPNEQAKMVKAGTLDLQAFTIASFPLEEIEKAIDWAGQSKALNLTVVCPS